MPLRPLFYSEKFSFVAVVVCQFLLLKVMFGLVLHLPCTITMELVLLEIHWGDLGIFHNKIRPNLGADFMLF